MLLLKHGMILDPVPEGLLYRRIIIHFVSFVLRFLRLRGDVRLVAKVAQRILVVGEFLILRSLQILLLFL